MAKVLRLTHETFQVQLGLLEHLLTFLLSVKDTGAGLLHHLSLFHLLLPV